MIFKKLIFFVIVLSGLKARAQYPLPDPAASSSYTNFVQPPPTAASIGKYADFPVSYFTGVPNINIPIYDLKDGDAELPISLSYHASGIRVSEVASWVGLGWCLNAGGAIIRTVRGTADEGSYSSAGNGYSIPYGYYQFYGLQSFPKLPYADASGQPVGYFTTGLPYTHYASLYLGSGQADGEPDLFTFNFNGHSGKFLFDEYRTPHLLKDDNLKIAVNFNGTDFISWVITDEKGVQYKFGQNQNGNNFERVASYYPSSPFQQPITTWHLNQIIYPNNNDTVNFTYTNEFYFYADLSPESEAVSFEPVGQSSGKTPSVMCDNTSNIITGKTNPPPPNVSSLSGVRLTTISSKNINIIFEADNSRKDIDNMCLELDKIKIYSKITGQCIKQFRFSYSYFASPFPNPFASLTSIPGNPSYFSDSLRLKLLSLDEFSGDSSIVKPPYIFTYQDSFPLPRRLSFDQDHWGFSNNSSTPYNQFLTPGGVWLSGIGCSASFGANREPSWPQMSAGTLLSIKDPLGATTTFQYEANQAPGYLVTGNSMIGGLRIKKITVTDNITGTAMIRQFQYGTGVLYKVPSYVSNYMNEFYLTDNSGGTTGYVSNGYGLGRSPGAIKQSQSITPMQDADGSHIGYNTVTEVFGANGENGQKVYTYDQGYINADQKSSKINPNVFFGSNNFASPGPESVFGLSGTAMLLGNGKFNEILPATLDSNLEVGYDNLSYYPSAPEQIDLTRGNLIQTQTFDASGNLLQQVNNVYDTTVHGSNWIRGVKGFENPAPNIANAIDDALTFYILHLGISHLTYTATTNYENGSPIKDTVRYVYESPYHTLATGIKTTRSNGDSVLQKTYYSFDYFPTATPDGIFGTMQQMNILAPVAKEVWENNRMTGSVVTAYSDFNTDVTLGHVIKPYKIYMLANSTSLNTTQAGETTVYAQKSALLPNNYYVERMDLFNDPVGKPLQVMKFNDKATSYQWGYGKAYPVTKSENASNTYTTGQTSQAQYHTNQFIASGSQQSTQNFSFSIYPAGTITLTVNYNTNPGSNPAYNIGYTLSGPNSFFQTGTFCAGTGCAPQYQATTVNYNNAAIGSYTLTMTPYSNVNTANLPLNLNCAYAALGPVSAGIKEFFYEGFEENSSSNVQSGNAHTGNKYYNGSYPVPYTLPNSRSYLIQWWNYTTQWNFNQAPFTTSGMTLSGKIDDIRVFPVDAQISTYTYKPLIGISSELDPSGKATFYEYDSLGRLLNIKDYLGNITNNFQYNYTQACTSCSIPMKTYAGAATISYPVGVFSVANKLLGNATTQAQYISLWNGDSNDHTIGTLAVGSDSMHFNLTVNSGQTSPGFVIGCRYFQIDLAYNMIDACHANSAAYIDFGDGTGMKMPATVFDSNTVRAPNTTIVYEYNWESLTGLPNYLYWVHTYPDTSLKTLTFYHNDGTDGISLDNAYAPATSLTKLKNLRGIIPQYTTSAGVENSQQSSMSSFANVKNWNAINSVTTFYLSMGDAGASPNLHVGYAQDFMANNKNLRSIETFNYGYWNESNGDSTFKISRLKSNWNTYFTQLTSLNICDRDWNHENLGGLNNLNSVFICAGSQNYNNVQTGNSLIPMTVSSIDNIINQVAGGAGLYIMNGTINLLTAGTARSSTSNSGVTQLKSKGWTIIVNGVTQ